MVERFDKCVARDLEPAAQILPDRDAEFVAGLGETEKSVAAVAADVAACPGTAQASRTSRHRLLTAGMSESTPTVFPVNICHLEDSSIAIENTRKNSSEHHHVGNISRDFIDSKGDVMLSTIRHG